MQKSQVSNKKPEHVDGQQPTVVGPLVAKITPSSSCRLPDPSDALRHGSIAVKKTCTPSAKQPDPPDGLQHAMESDEAPFTPPEVSQIPGDNNQTCDDSHFLP